jgi:hypothetical protein
MDQNRPYEVVTLPPSTDAKATPLVYVTDSSNESDLITRIPSGLTVDLGSARSSNGSYRTYALGIECRDESTSRPSNPATTNVPDSGKGANT